ncbi:MAG: hypothetical protein AAB788_00935 [Patescibacteria group bacterium]
MVNTVVREATPQGALQSAEKVMPTLRATEKTSKAEMDKLIDQVEKNIGQSGQFARVYGEKGAKGRFTVFNEPVIIVNNSDGTQDIGLVFATVDGFKGNIASNVATSDIENKKSFLRHRITEVESVAKEHNTLPMYGKAGGKDGVYVGPGYGGFVLDDINDPSIVVNAIESSIAEAQKVPKASIAKNRQTIAVATMAQATLARANLKK